MISIQAVVISGKVYVGVGSTWSFDDHYLIQQYSPADDKWSFLPPSVWYGSYIILVIVGGKTRHKVMPKDISTCLITYRRLGSVPAVCVIAATSMDVSLQWWRTKAVQSYSSITNTCKRVDSLFDSRCNCSTLLLPSGESSHGRCEWIQLLIHQVYVFIVLMMQVHVFLLSKDVTLSEIAVSGLYVI